MSLTDRDPEKLRAWQRRSAQRYQESRPRTRIKPVGAKARREQSAIDAFRAAVRARSGGLCELNCPGCPPGRHEGHHAHHCAPSDRDRGVHDPERGLWGCWQGHRWVHDNPAASYEAGWLLKAAA